MSKVLPQLRDIVGMEGSYFWSSCFSSPSLSHKIFYRKYNFSKIPERCNMSISTYARKSYFGGRCEVFGNVCDGEKIMYFDFSGMYAQCMSQKFHNGEGVFSLCGDFRQVGFHTIEYYSDFCFFPVLPRHSVNGKLVFANGYGVGTF
jgi:hypothetical protein